MSPRNLVLFATGGGLLAIAAAAAGLYAIPTSVRVAKIESPAPQRAVPGGPAVGSVAKPAIESAASPAAKSAAPKAPDADNARPSFDVARVEPDGAAVFAGRAAPGARIELLADGRKLAEATANADGEWAILPDAPLGRGDHLVTLRATGIGGAVTLSAQSLAIGVRDGASPLVVLAEADAPSRVLQAPAAEPAAKPAETKVASTEAAPRTTATVPAHAAEPDAHAHEGSATGASGGLAIRSVDYQEGGRLLIAGEAKSGATLRAYLNDTYVGDGAAAGAGFTFSLKTELPPGHYRVRVDEVAPQSGSVLRRVETRFDRQPALLAAAEPTGPGGGQAASRQIGEPQVVTIRRGDNLWNIARKEYGRGRRYTTIYEANVDQIRDPHWIYPNQIFVLPLSERR